MFGAKYEKMYNYQQEKQIIFTDEGQKMFLKIRDNVDRLSKLSGAFTMMAAISTVTGDSFSMLACVDRLVELGEIREIPQQNVAGQHRVFVKI